jgi:hypothetical protein
VCEGLVVGFALLTAVRPRVRTVPQVAALAAAIIVAVEICMGQWFYFYIVWFAPLVFVALFGVHDQITARPATRREEPIERPSVAFEADRETPREREPLVVAQRAMG